ncbi:hypothetical protein [Nocardia transvalensis]|uniref:hypothetical protein n=1 Tax=Nocardia transvalensis TaxID=37333 RepID=UPI001893410E|nr:hypothetical protein [Nocardia transvalensis]MBF6329619.1 hypothetical protein [Nocardia transvalensis]
MTLSYPRQSTCDSLLFGNVLITRTEHSVAVRLESDGSTVVTIERIGPRTRKSVPIGTRDPKCLTGRVGDREIRLLPGSGRVVKRTYRVVAEVGDRVLSLGPKDIGTCRFIEGHPHETEKQFGEFTAHSDGSIAVEWAVPVTIKGLGTTVVPPEPSVEDVLIGYALAAAFGTGALSLTTIVLGLVSAAFPG